MSGDATGGWVASAASTVAALTATEVKATPGAGKSIVIEQIVFSNEGTANSFVVKDEDAVALYPPTGAIYLGANQTFNSGRLNIRVTANKNVNVTTSATDHSTTIINGYTA